MLILKPNFIIKLYNYTTLEMPAQINKGRQKIKAGFPALQKYLFMP